VSQSNQFFERPIDRWRDKLASSDTLVFTRTVSDVNLVALDDLTSASDLSKVVGHDVSMAARFLRIASSALFNRQGRTVDTINAAIVRIGFDAIRELAVSLALIEHVLNGEPHARVTRTMTRAFHAATQAKALVGLANEDRLEEVFAAALLHELGSMLFWARGDEEGVALEALQAAGVPEAEAERQVLGFSLLELSAELADEWHLGELMKLALSSNWQAASRQSAERSAQIRAVLWGHEIARTVEQEGQGSPAVRELLQRIASELDLDEVALNTLVEESFQESGDIATRYGMPKAAAPTKTAANATGHAMQQSTPTPTPNPQSQIEILQEIGDAISQRLSLNELVALVLKGIFAGLGFDRTYFALLSPDRKQLQCRYVLGNTPPEFLNSTRPFLPKDDPFSGALHSASPVLLTPQDLALQPENSGWLSYSTCAIMPIVVQAKPIGLLYADRAVSQDPLDDTAFRGFQLFGQQLVTILSTISNTKS
jgi:HD-like signal output (HDOD) protein